MTLVVNDRYTLLRQLGSGGMGRVYLAQDLRQADMLVALKTLSPEAATTPYAASLADEFRLLADLSHPYVVRAYDFSSVRYVVGEPVEGEPTEAPPLGAPLLTREFVAGTPLANLIGTLELDAQLRIMLELAATLHYLHRQGVLHRDVKPDNVLVAAAGTLHRQLQARLVDFGLACLKEQSTSPVGNARYLAPEVLLGGTFDEAAERYALGVVCYELLTGRTPYEGNSAAELARAHVHQTIPPLPGTLPPPLITLVMRLLEREPTRRPSSQELLSELQSLIQREGAPSPATWNTTGAARMVGRQQDIDFFTRCLDELGNPSADQRPIRTLVLTGPPGIGKTRLVQRLKQQAQLSGFRVGMAQCHHGAETFLAARRLLSGLIQERPDLITSDRELLRTVLAGKPQTYSELPSPELTPAEVMVRVLDGARGFLEALSAEQRMVLILEDVHFIDPESLALMRHLLLHLSARQVLLVLTSWPPSPAHSEIDRLTQDLPLEVGVTVSRELEGLELTAVQHLLARTFGEEPLNLELAEQLRQQTDGNPLFIEEVLKLASTPAALTQRMRESHLPRAVGDAFRQQLKVLGEDALQTLKGIAVWGTPANPTEIMDITRQDRSECLGGLEEALACQLLREQGTGYWFWHSTMVQLIEEHMSPEEMRDLHRRAGRRREASGGLSDPEQLSRLVLHFTRARDPARALGYALTGARTAADRFLSRQAIELYERARELSLELVGIHLGGIGGLVEVRQRLASLYAATGDLNRAETEARSLLDDPWLSSDRPARSRLRVLLGEVAMRRSDLAGALKHFSTALEETSDPLLCAGILDDIAELHIRRSEVDDALYACHQAIQRLGNADAPSQRGSIAFHRGRCAELRGMHREALQHFNEARQHYQKLTHPPPGMAATLNAIATILNYFEQYQDARQVLLDALDLQERQGALEGAASTLDRLALNSLGLADIQAAITYGKRSVATWRRLGNQQGEAKAAASLGIIFLTRGLYRDSLASTQQALELQRKLGDRQGSLNSLINLSIQYLEIGAHRQAQEILTEALELASSLGHRLRLGRCHHVLGVIETNLGSLKSARNHLEQAYRVMADMENKELLSDVLCAVSELEVKEEQFDTAIEHSREALELVKGSQRLTAQLQAHLAEARAILSKGKGDFKALLTDLEGFEEQSQDPLHPDQLWQLWEVRGRLCLALGRPQVACKYLSRSMEIMRACYEQIPEQLRPLYINDPRRKQVRKMLEQALKLAQR